MLVPADLRFDLPPLVGIDVADLHQRIDEQPQALFGRQPAGGGVRRIDEAERLEVRHHVADRCRRQVDRQEARQVAGADRLAGGEIGFDDLPKNLPRPEIEIAQFGRPLFRRRRLPAASAVATGDWRSNGRHRVLCLLLAEFVLAVDEFRLPGSLPSLRFAAFPEYHEFAAGIQCVPVRIGAITPHNPRLSTEQCPMRPSKRQPDELRPVQIERAVSRHAEGSCLIKFGHTHVLCTASLEERLPPWLKGQGRGWVTAEYAMLPRATSERTRREVTQGHPSGRTQEIQRLIGRSMRAVVDLVKLGERQITIDCDVIQADGGTRTAAITGAWVALHDCIQWMKVRDMIGNDVLRDQIAAVSCGIYKGTPVLDLDYVEDSDADADSNFVMTGSGGIVEVQGTAEKTPFSQEAFDQLMLLARKGIRELVDLQKMTVG